MIGREKQLQEVIQHIGSVLKSTSQENVIFITGEAGIGKSTFLKAVAEKASSLHNLPIIATAQCSTPLAGQNIGEAEALKPWVDAADAIVRHNSEELKNSEKVGFDFKEFFWETAPAWIELVPVVGSAIGAGVEIITTGYEHLTGNKKPEKSAGSAISQQQIFQQYINLLLKISESSPLVIILDDFHWADDSSCNLLFAAARQLQQKPIAFLIAYRPDDALTARDGEGHSILHIKNELERYDFSREIEVPKFSEENLDEFLREHYPNYTKDAIFEKWLTHEAGGNALFVIEFLKTLEEDNYIDRQSGVFTGNFDAVEIPKSAFAVIHERIRRLSDDAREFLQYASVEGETFTTAVLSQITELMPLKTLQRLRSIEDKHHIVKSIGKQVLYSNETTAYQFAHALIHRAMYETLEEEERELLHAAILDIVKKEWNEAKETGKNLTGMANRIAIHAEIAKDYLFAAEVLLKAAQERWKEYAETEAVQNIDSALSLLKKIENQSEHISFLKGELLYLRADIYQHKAQFEKAVDSFTEAELVFTEFHSESRMNDAIIKRSHVYSCQGKFEESVQLLQALLSAQLTLSQKATTLSYLGKDLSEYGNPKEGIEKLTEALRIAHEIGDFNVIAHALDGLGTAYFVSQEYDKSLSYFEQGLAVAKNEDNYLMQSIFLGNIPVVYKASGEDEKALKYYEAALLLFRKNGLIPSEVITLENIGVLFRDIGQYDKSILYLTEALEICHKSNDRYGKAFATHLIARTYYDAKKIDKAKEFAISAKLLANELNDSFTAKYNSPLLEKLENTI
ncbi:MAG: tetratricopeptide repeat protein [Bacteroidota bacterium]